MSSPRDEIASILGDAEWTVNPAMKPEDDLMLKRLQDMLQSTADDLKSLSSQLAKSRLQSVQIKSSPMLLDEEFNEKMHLKEVVDAKFNGRILVDKAYDKNFVGDSDNINKESKTNVNVKKKGKLNAGVQVDLIPKTVRKSVTSQTNVKPKVFVKQVVKELSKQKEEHRPPSRPKILMVQEEYKYNSPEDIPEEPTSKLVVQEMPSVSIRGELKEHKLTNLNILPSEAIIIPQNKTKNSVVIQVLHPENTDLKSKAASKESISRKVIKLPVCQSSESIVKTNSESEELTQNTKKSVDIQINSSRSNKHRKKEKAETIRKRNETPRLGSEGWKKKLDAIYGAPSTSKRQVIYSPKSTNHSKIYKKVQVSKPSPSRKELTLNNAEYVPYSKLTLGGVNVSDIENEIADVTNKADLPLSPILDKILSSQDNSTQNSPRVVKNNIQNEPFSISDAKLMKEVLKMDRTIKKTLNKDMKNPQPILDYSESRKSDTDKESKDSYSDDFDNDDEKSERSVVSKDICESSYTDIADAIPKETSKGCLDDAHENEKNKKGINLSQKQVDVFEFIHSVETQETATQSQRTHKISLKETQTSPRNEGSVHSIQNDVAASAFDTSGEVDKMFEAEKEFIKKFILEEYGDMSELKKNFSKPAFMSDNDSNNIATQPKNTQTSPSKVKSIMTSPLRTTTKTTSPLHATFTVNRPSSPVSNLDSIKSDSDDAGIAVNLSSPKFNLRLPQSSREVLSNLGSAGPSRCNLSDTLWNKRQKETTSESNGTESDSSSLGQIRIRKKGFKDLTSESSTSSYNPSSVGQARKVVPSKSEGEISLGQVM